MKERIAVVGAGAIGASIGAYLIREGQDVTLIDQWAAHVEKMKHGGLTLTDLKETFTVPVKALHVSEVSSVHEAFDIVYLSVKSYDTRWSTYLIEPLIKPGGFILPAQNSLNDEIVAHIVGYHRTVGCVPTISAGVYNPGQVVRTDPMTTHCFTVGELSGRITPRVREVVAALQVIGPSKATTNIWGVRWAKMVTNCMGNALAGLIGPNVTTMTEAQRDFAALVRVCLGSEVVRVAQALGVAVEPIGGISAKKFATAKSRNAITAIKSQLEKAWSTRRLSEEQIERLGAPGRASLLQDVIKGRQTEVDELNGLVVSKGRELGVPTPVNEAIVELMNALERGGIEPNPANLEYFKSCVPT